MKTRPLTPEHELAAHWRTKARLDTSDFDSLTSIPLTDDRTLAQVKHELARRIFAALPLTEEEYYLALAFKFLLTDVPYKVFFMTHWHESLECRTYKSLQDCEFCKDPAGRNSGRKNRRTKMDNDDKMGSKAYAWFDHTFMLFGSLCKSFAAGTPIEDWQGWADQWFSWAKGKAKELVDEAYNGKEPEPARPEGNGKPPDDDESFVSPKQAKRFYGIAYGEGGYTKEGIDRLLKHHGCKSAYKIKERRYEEFCQMARSKSLAHEYNKESLRKEL